MRLRLAALISLAALPAAGEFLLELPVQCPDGMNCFIQNFVDRDPGPGVRDFQCGVQAYDGHKGTDFALPDLAAQRTGVPVLAAAGGAVKGTRYDMVDAQQTSATAPDVTGRECGNGLVLDHGDGWETQYCHLAQGSVSVRTGDIVQTGDQLGLIGLSGQTQFPHLHFSVRQNGQRIDPFAPTETEACGLSSQTLWSEVPPTPQGGLINIGFSAGIPAYDDIKNGTANAEKLQTGDDLVIWGYAFSGQAGDIFLFEIIGPEGFTFQSDVTLDKTQAVLFRATGKRVPDEGWSPGQYEGSVIHKRGDAVLGQQTATILIE